MGKRFEEIASEVISCIAVNEDIVCKGCIFAKDPQSSYCEVYHEGYKDKPNNIYFDGEPCKYRREGSNQ